MTTHGPITLDAPSRAPLMLRSMRGQEELGRPFEYELELLSESAEIAARDLLGQLVSVHLELPSAEPRHFSGYVSRFAATGPHGSFEAYRLTLRPWFWLLSRASNSRIFQNKTVPEIVKSIFREHGFSDFEDSLLGSYPAREYAVQYRETDFGFVSRLLEEEGIYYFFRHEAARHLLVLADDHSAHTAAPGYEVVPLLTSADRRTAQSDHLESWQVVSRLESGALASSDFDFEKPKASLLVRAAKGNRHAHGDFELFEYPGLFVERERGEAYAKLRLEERHEREVTVVASGNARGVGAGHLFTLADHPSDSQNREYLVLRASYQLTAPEYESQAESARGEVFRSELELSDSSRVFRPARSTPKVLVSGPQTALVVGPGGEEIWTDNYARIKVKFHWNRYDPGDENSSCWVRVAQTWAGSHWGAQFVPRIGQEVVVEFLDGDPDRPLVVGSVYNGDNAPPFELPGNRTQSGVRTRSLAKGGAGNCNEIRFEDKKGSEQLFFQAEKDLEVLVKNDESDEVAGNRKVHVGKDETLAVSGQRTTTIDRDESLTVGGSRTGTIAGDETLSVGGSRTKIVAGSQTASIDGSETTVVVGPRAVAAASESLVVGLRTKNVAGPERTSIGTTRNETVGGSESVDVSGSRSHSVKKDESLSVSGKRSQSIGKDDSLRVGQKLTLDAGDQVVLKAGSASITLKKNGEIVIRGKNLTLDGTGKIKVKATSNISIKGRKISHN